jgi:flagellar hook-basal body complex protein FliE
MDGIKGLGVSEVATQIPVAQSKSTGGADFAAELGKAIDGVQKLEANGDAEAQKLALGGGNLHEAALALEKADISMRVLTKVRNKVVDAYQEVMRMSV